MLEFCILLLLFSSSLLIYFKTALSQLGILEIEQEFQKYPKYYGLILSIKKALPHLNWEEFKEYIAIHIQIYRLFFSVFGAYDLILSLDITLTNWHLLGITFIILSVIVAIEVFMRLLAIAFPLYAIKVSGLISGILLFWLFPLTAPIMLIQRVFLKKQETKSVKSPHHQFKSNLRDFIYKLDSNQSITIQEKKLLLSVASLRERMVKEIMVPRVSLYSLSIKKSLMDCLDAFVKEGYSRIPIYEDNIDNIVGVLLSKDILDYLAKSIHNQIDFPLDTSIQSLIKPILFCPETKKIADLLQDFRTTQIHLSIVVNEYGGTEGMLTIEDILEELVGEIEDEFDIDQPPLFSRDQTGGYLMNAKTSLVDIENEIGLIIPPSPHYDTIGGFIVHLAGFIPKKGWKIHFDLFSIEVISSSDKSLDKVKVVPISKTN